MQHCLRSAQLRLLKIKIRLFLFHIGRWTFLNIMSNFNQSMFVISFGTFLSCMSVSILNQSTSQNKEKNWKFFVVIVSFFASRSRPIPRRNRAIGSPSKLIIGSSAYNYNSEWRVRRVTMSIEYQLCPQHYNIRVYSNLCH